MLMVHSSNSEKGVNACAPPQNQFKLNIVTEKEKNDYRKALVPNSNKSFDSEFIRTTNLERTIIDKYGFEGLRLLFENRNSANYYKLSQFSNNSPWTHLNNKNLSEFIDSNFVLVHSLFTIGIKSLNCHSRN